MANNIFAEFDKTFDTKALAEEVKNSADSPVYKDVPLGEYMVKVEKLELVATKETHKPMVSGWFRIVEGDYKGQLIFMNQLVDEAFKIHIMKQFLISLDTDLDIDFVNYTQFGNLLMDVHEAVDGKLEYHLKYGENRKGFKTYEIIEAFDVD